MEINGKHLINVLTQNVYLLLTSLHPTMCVYYIVCYLLTIAQAFVSERLLEFRKASWSLRSFSETF